MNEQARGPFRSRRVAVARVGTAVAVALAFSLGVYALLEALRPEWGVVSFSFLLMLPAAVSAFVAYVADPWAERSLGFYLWVPFWLLLAVIVGAVLVLREGTVCVVMLSPLWMISGWLGAGLTYRFRPRGMDARVFSSAVLLVPLLVMAVEPSIPLPTAEPVVTRSVEIAAPVERIWPLLRGIPDVRAHEGRWNLTEDVIGVPRPLGARLVGEGVGAERLAQWGEHIRFRERITEWAPGRAIGWRFIFDDLSGWDFTDRHLRPNSPYFGVLDGRYEVTPLSAGRTRVTLQTRYRIRTPVNEYSRLWGEVFLGDVENNLLALVRQRAEARG